MNHKYLVDVQLAVTWKSGDCLLNMLSEINLKLICWIEQNAGYEILMATQHMDTLSTPY